MKNEQKSVYDTIYDIITSFPKNTNFYSKGARMVMTKKITHRLLNKYDIKEKKNG
jgi:hypothetical protein